MIFILSVLTGMFFIIVKTLNMLLAKEVGVYKSGIVNHLAGLTGCILIMLLFLRNSTFEFTALFNIGIFPLLGGVMGATFVALSNYTFAKTKVLISTVLILVGQTAAAIFLDYHFNNKFIDIKSVIGISLIILAVVLYNSKEASNKNA